MSYKRKIIGTSLEEIRFLYFVRQIFPDAKNRFKLKYKYTKNAELDIFIPHLNFAIEYDGSYYHSSEEMIKKDENKNKACRELDVCLLRIREKGLNKISQHDIIYEYSIKKSYKTCCQEISEFIKEKFILTDLELESISNLDYDKFEIGQEVLDLYNEIEHNHSLLIKNSTLCKEWNYNKNNGLSPDKIRPNSNLIVWWKCGKCNNEWQSTIHERHRGWNNCIRCKSIGIENPEIISEWDNKKNKKTTPFNITKGSHKKVWWICNNGHEYKMNPNDRNKRSSCPYCSGHRLHKNNSLATVNPEISKEWHLTLNGNKTPETVFPNSRTERAWWKCKKNKEHVWEAKIHTRHQQKQGCPYCDGKKVSKENSLLIVRPVLAKQWHPTKNGDLTPNKVTRSSGKIAWWKCLSCNHEWEAYINNRVRSSGKCPNCKHK